jgi:UDP-N-acetylmuramoyl-tripeptide--D-alanyl-D-alanine ligase
MQYLEIIVNTLLTITLALYLITNLQWYNYKIQRVILKHHKISWHILYFVLPIGLFYTLPILYLLSYYVLYVISFIFWYKKLDRPLVFTSRVKRFFYVLLFVISIISVLCFVSKECNYGVLMPLLLTWVITTLLEKMFFISYKHKAKQKLKTYKDLTIVAITASYGKTSIKNYLYQVLNKKYNTYKTPRSINTIAGIVQDVNNDLPIDTQIYIAEAGARQKGDIEEISLFLEPQYTIIGSVGEQHIEYFKTLDNIIYTKMEILKSPRLVKGFVHESVPIKSYDTITKFPNNLNILSSTLDGIKFELDINNKKEFFESNILGSFNAINLSSVILMSLELGIHLDDIKKYIQNITSVEHRLHLTKVNGKLILDDSFNGNLEGMIEAVKISATYEKRKVIITPGLVESTNEANEILAKEINSVFDLVIITGSLNINILQLNIDDDKVIVLSDKSQMQNVLAKHTKEEDLILFANDAPNFI